MKKQLFTGLLCLIMQLTFAEKNDSIKTLDISEVTVTATRMGTRLKNLPQKAEIIDGTIIKTLPSENLAELLKRTTNLDIIQYPGLTATVGMRGFSPSAHSRSYTLLLINGKPSGTTNLASINTDNIERVEVIKGPYSALYGSDAMGGVINVITKSAPGNEGGSVKLSAGSFGSLSLDGSVYGNICDKTSVYFGYSRKEQTKDFRIGRKNLLEMTDKEKFMLDNASYGDIMRNSKFQINHINANIKHELTNNWNASADVMYTFAYDVETPGNYWGSYGQSKKDIERVNLYGTLAKESENNSFSFSPYYTSENNPNYTNNSDTGFVSFISHIKEYGFKMHDNINFGDFNLLLGADIDVHDYSSERFSDKAKATAPYQPDHKNTKSALFSQVAYSVGGLFINGGARFDHISYDIEKNDSLIGTGGSETYNIVNPSVGAQYTFPSNFKLHGSYGTAFSVPDAFKMAGEYKVSTYFPAWDFWWIKNYEGNPDLGPEKSSTYDLGIAFNSNNNFLNADLTYFNTNHKDKIVEFITQDNITTFKNANIGRMGGVELVLSSNIGALFDNTFKLEIYGNFTKMLVHEVDETFSDINGNDSIATRGILYTSRDNGNFGLFFDNYSGFSTRLHARYLGSRLERDSFMSLRTRITADDYYVEEGYSVADKILEHPDYLVFDYSVNYTLNDNKRFGIKISNLLDENYTEKDGYNMPGRLVTASFTYMF